MKAYRISEVLYIVIAVISVKEAIALGPFDLKKPIYFSALLLWLFLCISFEVITAKNLIGENLKWI